jgi:type I restriction-modification system DNA methylase subunit
MKPRNKAYQDKVLPGDFSHMFQTPPQVAEYMAGMIPHGAETVLEPTSGKGNLVRAIHEVAPSRSVTAPKNFFTMRRKRFDCIVMNPPFSSKWTFGCPDPMKEYGMKMGYWMLDECMEMSDDVIALMPWFTLTDSDKRLEKYKNWGLVSVTALPRKTFNYSRIQTCVIQLKKGYYGPSWFHTFDWPKPNK